MQKKIILRIVFSAEVILFGWFYYQGAQGMQAVRLLKNENEEIAQQISLLKGEVQDIDHQIIAWKTDPLFKEKIAREQLDMAHAGDQIYIFD